jgi:hypothetical protein
MRDDLVEYLRAYRAYVSANLGWAAASKLGAVWLAGMCVPMTVRAFVSLPMWAGTIWMIVWALLGYVLAPYGMWKHQRAIPNIALHDRE